jgi:hypothetical protein
VGREKTIQLALRVTPAFAARIDKIAAAMSARAFGAEITRSEAARLTMERGAPSIEAELGLAAPEADKPPKRSK